MSLKIDRHLSGEEEHRNQSKLSQVQSVTDLDLNRY